MTAPVKRRATTRPRAKDPAIPDGFITEEHWAAHLNGRDTSPVLEAEFLTRFAAAERLKTVTTGLTFLDFFCGAGGEAQGLHAAGMTGVLAANHWDKALISHWTNFPDVDHFKGDIQQPGVVESMPWVPFFWASPSCPAWSQANGEARTFDKPMSLFELDTMADEEREVFAQPGSSEEREKSRALMWDVPRYLEAMQRKFGKPVLAGVVENVVEVRAWVRWEQWVESFHKLGYETRVVALNSMHVKGPKSRLAPQSRDRFYFVYWHKSLGRRPNFEKWLRPEAWCSKHQVVRAVQTWKKSGVEMGRYGAQYVYRCPESGCHAVVEPYAAPALAAIDLTLPSQAIGDRKKAIAAKTRERVRAGMIKHWPHLFTATTAGHTFERRPGVRTRSVHDPMVTLHTTASESLAQPLGIPTGGTWRDEAWPTNAPMPTRLTRECDALLLPCEGRENKSAMPLGRPMRTQTARAELALIQPEDALLVPLRNHGEAFPVGQGALPTFAASGTHHALAMMMRNNGTGTTDPSWTCTPVADPMHTLTTTGHQSVLQWDDVENSALYPYDTGVLRGLGQPLPTQTALAGDAIIRVTDDDVDACLLRMLALHEIGAGMAFGPEYVVIGNKREQVRQMGNAVTPNVAEVLGLMLRECITGETLEPASWFELAA